MQLQRLLWTYATTRSRRFARREALERYQERRLLRFTTEVLPRSPWFRPHLQEPMSNWPVMSKALMMQDFDRINTANLRLVDVLACAMRAEESRDFSPTIGRYSVGLSSGTSGSRGVFVAAPHERATWAGAILAKLLPAGLFRRERIALFLRANNKLYTSVRTPWLSFSFFDLFTPFEQLIEQFNANRPTIVIAPSQVLRALAVAVRSGQVTHRPKRVIAAAEVLEPLDRALLTEVFGQVDEVYQATEGFLGATCEHGTLHLNEEFIHVEPEWIDDMRFVPIITDFTRTTQPIVRYRIDDILVRRVTPCPCGSHSMAIERIEGRCDDMLILPAQHGGSLTVFADVCARALAQSLPTTADYRLVQTTANELTLAVHADADTLRKCRNHLVAVFGHLGVAVDSLRWTLSTDLPPASFMVKRRRITRLRSDA